MYAVIELTAATLIRVAFRCSSLTLLKRNKQKRHKAISAYFGTSCFIGFKQKPVISTAFAINDWNIFIPQASKAFNQLFCGMFLQQNSIFHRRLVGITGVRKQRGPSIFGQYRVHRSKTGGAFGLLPNDLFVCIPHAAISGIPNGLFQQLFYFSAAHGIQPFENFLPDIKGQALDVKIDRSVIHISNQFLCRR